MKYICIKDLIWYPGLIGQLSGEQPKIICKKDSIRGIKIKNGYCKVNRLKLNEEELIEYFIPLADWRDKQINSILED